MKNLQKISTATLFLRKLSGCLQTFGLGETARRIFKETSRLVSGSRRDIDISMLTEKFSIGAAPKAHETVDELIHRGFQSIIDVRGERKDNDLLCSPKDGLKVYHVPIYDDWRPKPHEFFKEISDAAKKMVSNGGGKFFICCGAGEHRAPLAGAVALIEMGYSLEEAMNTIKKARPVAEFLPAYVSSLEDFYLKKME